VYSGSTELITIRKRVKAKKEKNLAATMGQDLGAEDEYANLLPEEHFWPHFKPAIDINNVIDQTFYTEGTWQSFLFKYQTYDFVLNAYTPHSF